MLVKDGSASQGESIQREGDQPRQGVASTSNIVHRTSNRRSAVADISFVALIDWLDPTEGKATWENVDFSPDGYLLGSYRIATAPEPNSSRLTSLKSTRFDSPANNVGP